MVKARDYSKGKIYALKSGELIYIGSTTKQYLSQREANHKAGFNQWKKGKGNYVSSFLILEKEYTMVLLETYPCQSNDELKAREQYHMDLHDCVNKQKAYTGMTYEEYNYKYQQEHKEEKKEYMTKYTLEHKEEKKEYNYKYQQEHREEIKEQKANYRIENKEQICQKRREKYTCECGSIICKWGKARHEKSKKHIDFISHNI